MSVTKPLTSLITLARLPNKRNGTLLIHKDPKKAGKNFLITQLQTFRWKYC